MFVLDYSGNPLEFKAFTDESMVFCQSNLVRPQFDFRAFLKIVITVDSKIESIEEKLNLPRKLNGNIEGLDFDCYSQSITLLLR